VGEPVEDEDPERDMLAVGACKRRVRILKNSRYEGLIVWQKTRYWVLLFLVRRRREETHRGNHLK